MTAAFIQTLQKPLDLLALHASQSERYPFLLETVAPAKGQGQYDLLFVSTQQHLTLDHNGLSSNAITVQGHDFLEQLDVWWTTEGQSESINSPLPFQGGWFVFLGYELAQQIEPTLSLPAGQNQLPQAMAMRCPAAIIYDRNTRRTHVICEHAHRDLLSTILTDIEALTTEPLDEHTFQIDLKEDDPQHYLDGVQAIKDYIKDGDIFQANLSRAWQGESECSMSHTQLYRQLRDHNPGPFSGLCKFNKGAIISSSPERLVRVSATGLVETRPIAGTRPRASQPTEDLALSQRLLSHPKERAEHIMLIDLERNDLGRVCEPGSVQVNELLTLESYAHVHHIVSNIQGQLRAGTRPGEVIRSVFPGGTITGCPKVRCMEIIADLEKTARGPYTGSMGYLNHDGSMDLNILIRTIVQEDHQITFRAGAGIVADSRPDKELEETRIKALGMINTLKAGKDTVSAC